MKERSELKKSILLCGESDGERFKRTFTIVRTIDDGGSCICYEAYHEASGRGVLKEFYPKEAYGLERDENGQLIHPAEFGDGKERFERALREYLEPYEMLLSAKRDGPERELATFIPAFEIYYGCNERCETVGTVYIWTPDAELETFDNVCGEIHAHPERDPEHKLVTVLSAVESLTRCVCALHRADMVHRDIKPANFGFVKRGNETLTQTLSLFDINSVCSVYSRFSGSVGTKGYMEPEAGYEDASNQTDIYSIGAVLFYAVIVSDETMEGGYLYHPAYYDRLRELVGESRLIRASEANSHPRLRNILTVILQKCLCRRTGRYANCEELLKDLETALYYALPSDITRRSRAREKWVLTDVEKSLDRNVEKNSMLAMQYHLYEKPLYQCVSGDETAVNVLVVGFGNYGQKFLDVCLQVGQIRGKTLNVTVVSDDITDKEIYCAERPELAEFFNIDGALDGSGDTYGNITFQVTELAQDDQKANAEILQNIMCEHCGERHPHYVFIALGEDALNLAAARACRVAVDVFEVDCVVCCVCENGRLRGKAAAGLSPVYVNADVRGSRLYEDVERMAFNTHLVWEKNLNIDYRAVRAEFKKGYNHDACVSSVLALKYKLYSVGIDLERCGADEAARRFAELCMGKSRESQQIRDELIWIEHRRWVTEKLCLGWRAIRNLEDCLGGVTKDEKRKRHVCIVRSRPGQGLDGVRCELWDKASEEKLGELDELDRLSVDLHRLLVKKAEPLRRRDLLSGSGMAGIRTLIEGSKKAVVAFQEWFTCLKDIWNGDIGKARLYKGLRNAFLEAADGLPEENRKSLRGQVEAFETVFAPILASMEYRDWKLDDVAFIDSIPFVLTYSEDACMAVPYGMGDNNAVFGNVAAATVVNPARILYLCLLEQEREVRALRETIPYVAGYMEKKRLKAAAELVVAYPANLAPMVSEAFEAELIKLGNGRIRRVKLIQLTELDELAPKLEVYLKRRQTGKRVFAVEKNDTRLSYMLQGAGLYRAFPNYRFDSAGMRFHESSRCDLFGYIRKTPHITVTDMAAFRLSSGESSGHPEFYDDYKELWDKYREKSGTWKLMCNVLGDYAGKNDTIASFRKKGQREKNDVAEQYLYLLPSACLKSAAKILEFLKTQDIAEQDSRANGYTTSSCEVVISDRCGYRAEYDRLFANVYALMTPDAVTAHLNTKSHEVNVVFDNLVVSGVQTWGPKGGEIRSLMEYLQGKGYVIGLQADSDGKLSFTYATRQIKALLTTAGKLLEVYTYHKVKELGQFDDVVSGFEIDWEGTDVKSEFDCVVTKGFRTLFVECKARTDIEQDFYFRLAKLRDQFGINASAVLVADTQERSFYDNAPVNAMQRKRGGMMDVVTIWKPGEIDDIGRTLLRVINGTYEPEEESANV